MTPRGRVIAHLVRVDELIALMREPDVRVVDVRWKLGDRTAGKAAYERGHIPGAVFGDLDVDLAATPESGARGRHPLPSPESFAEAMGRLGIGDGTRVIAYDDQSGAIASRLWFLLRYFGHETGAILDGGIDAYTQAGHALETSLPEAPSASGAAFRPSPRPELVAERDVVASRLGTQGTLLLDARAPERYRGDVEPIDKRAGHIPSAVNAPFAGNLDAGRFLASEALRERYRALGAFDKPTTVYCGSGVTACHDLLALALAGNEEAMLYPGSWSEWSHDADAPIATGG